MTERYCQVCRQTFNGNTTSIVIYDDKTKVNISGHDECINKLHEKINNIDNLHKKNVKQILKEIKFNKEEKGEG